MRMQQVYSIGSMLGGWFSQSFIHCNIGAGGYLLGKCYSIFIVIIVVITGCSKGLRVICSGSYDSMSWHCVHCSC